jgi:hypothetical protein
LNFSGALRSRPIRKNTGGQSFRFPTASSPTSSAPGSKTVPGLRRQDLGGHEANFTTRAVSIAKRRSSDVMVLRNVT